jgi:hypothetical protein
MIEPTVTFVRARPIAIIAAVTTWAGYPRLWRALLDEVHAHVSWGHSGPKGRKVMLYVDDAPTVRSASNTTSQPGCRVGWFAHLFPRDRLSPLSTVDHTSCWAKRMTR